MTTKADCHHCESKGYIELRDCSGEIQRSETCSFCGGLGYRERKIELESDRHEIDLERSKN
jgi:DnaJ-class molecular chaperone